jgi:hypothetical protein
MTGTTITEVKAHAADSMASAAELTCTTVEFTGITAELFPAATLRAGLRAGTSANTAKTTTVPAQPPDLSTETPRRLVDTLNPAVRAVSARTPWVATTMADRKGAIRHAEMPASVAAEAFTAAAVEALMLAVAAGGDRNFAMFPVDREIEKWREAICAERR